MATKRTFRNQRQYLGQNQWQRSVWLIVMVVFCGMIGSAVVVAQESPDEQSSKMTATLKNGMVFVGENDAQHALSLPQNARGIYQTGDWLYVALGSSGVQVYRLDAAGATLVSTIPSPKGAAVGFFTTEDRLWVESRSTSAWVLDGVGVDSSGAASAPVKAEEHSIPPHGGGKAKAATAVAAASAATKTQKNPLLTREEPIVIADVFPGEVKLNVGTDDGVKLKDRFEIYREISVTGHGETFVGKEMVAMVEVTAVNQKSAIAKLPRGDRVRKGDVAAFVKKRITQRNTIPEKLDHIVNLGLVARPILNLAGNSGGGTLIDIDASWYGKHTFAAFRIDPMAIGGTNDGGLFNSMLLVEGGYDGRAFAVGLGVGAGLTSGRMNVTIGDSWGYPNNTSANSGVAKHAAFALSQFIRLGPLDGLNLAIHNSFLFASINQVGSDDEGFTYGSTSAKINIPLGYRLNLFLGGGGSRLGHGYGEAGVHVWLRGNGDAGSIGVSGAVGGAAAWVQGADVDEWGDAKRRFMAGPMVSFGLNYRFGTSAK